jgi:hypothetical protein
MTKTVKAWGESWTVGEDCVVAQSSLASGEVITPAKIVSIGKHWITIQPKNQRSLSFDLQSRHRTVKGTVYGWAPQLMTTAEASRYVQVTRITKMLRCFTSDSLPLRTLSNKNMLQEVEDTLQRWLTAASEETKHD